MFKERKKKKLDLESPLPARAFPDLATNLASARRFNECSVMSPDVQKCSCRESWSRVRTLTSERQRGMQFPVFASDSRGSTAAATT